MNRTPTSITSLKVFAAAARHLNFSHATEELCLTQSAVSKQIRTLEEQLDVTLFLRVPQGLVLSDAGRFYIEVVQSILMQLRAASVHLHNIGNTSNILNLGVPSTLAQKWLIPRFHDFIENNPTVKVNFMPRTAQSSDVLSLDAEIRSCDERINSSLASDYILGREYVVVCSPELREKFHLKTADDLLKQALLEHVQSPMTWREWFIAAGLEQTLNERSPVAASCYEQYSVMIPAMITSIGVGIVPLFLVLDELRSGELVIPVQRSLTLIRKGFSLVYREEKRNMAVLQAFRTWLLTEAQKTEFECTEIKRQKLM